MTIERAHVRASPKPWGVGDLRPWNDSDHQAGLVGELSFEREDDHSPDTSLLLKLLFTSAPVSIQVHPDDAYANSKGLPNGKSEAWYILSATPEAQIALGVKQPATQQQLHRAIDDGSISDLVFWRPVKAGDVVSVPAGTIHAIGAGIVMAEIQQRSDVTYRLFDHGRGRPLDLDNARAATKLSPVEFPAVQKRLTDQRTLLVANSHFVFERIVLAANSNWRLDAERETCLFVLGGSMGAGALSLARGDAVLAQSERLAVKAGRLGVECLVAYTGIGGPILELLQPLAEQTSPRRRYQAKAKAASSPNRPLQ